MPEELTIYYQAHLVAAAVRLFVHQNKRQPVADDIAKTLSASLEKTHHLLHKMIEHDIIELVPSAYKEVIYLRDHTRIEELAEEGEGPSVIEKIKEVEEAKEEKITDIQKRFGPQYEDERKKDLFSQLQQKLKTGGRTDKPNPLDELRKK